MPPRTVTLKENVLGANAEKADANRRLLDSHEVLMVNLTSSPGSGKTSLIVRTIDRLRDRYRIAVIAGIGASSVDADRIAQLQIPTVEIDAAGACHLDAGMTRRALDQLDLNLIDLVFIENIGNLVCTADFDLGAHKNVVILSVPEGDDKPRKYPMIFLNSDVVLVNKIDVLPNFDFRLDGFPNIIDGLNPAAKVFAVSAKTGEGMDSWYSWLQQSKEGPYDGRYLQGAV